MWVYYFNCRTAYQSWRATFSSTATSCTPPMWWSSTMSLSSSCPPSCRCGCGPSWGPPWRGAPSSSPYPPSPKASSTWRWVGCRLSELFYLTLNFLFLFYLTLDFFFFVLPNPWIFFLLFYLTFEFFLFFFIFFFT